MTLDDASIFIKTLKQYAFLEKISSMSYFDLAVDNELNYLKGLYFKVITTAEKIPKEVLEDKEIKEKVTQAISNLEKAVKFKEKEPNKKRGVHEDIG